jgi:hypothetical protein
MTARTRPPLPPNPRHRDKRRDEELERERLEPGLNTDGKGDAGADPSRVKDEGNSNT